MIDALEDSLSSVGVPEQTVQDFIDSGDTLHWYCRGCDHNAKLDMARFGEKFGLDHGSLAPDIVPKLHCTRCGGTDIGLTRQPKGNEYRRPEEKPVNAYLKAKGGG